MATSTSRSSRSSIPSLFPIGVQARPAELERRRAACAFEPELPRQRRVSAALKAYALLTTSADRGAVRDLSKLA